MALQKKHMGLILGLSLILAAVRTAIITSTMEINNKEIAVYYLPDDNLAVTLFTAVIIALLALAVWSAFAQGKGKRVLLESKVSVAPASLVVAFLLIGASIIYFVSSPAAKAEGGNLQKFIVVLAVGSAVAFLFMGLRRADTSKNALAALTMLPIFLSAFRLLGDFINTSATPLASSGGYHILGLAAIMLCFLCEGKSHVSVCRGWIYFLFANLSVVFLLVYSVPNLILHCFFGGFDFDFSAALSAVDVGFVVYVSSRMSTARLEAIVKE